MAGESAIQELILRGAHKTRIAVGLEGAGQTATKGVIETANDIFSWSAPLTVL
jgi:hypothetical protein